MLLDSTLHRALAASVNGYALRHSRPATVAIYILRAGKIRRNIRPTWVRDARQQCELRLLLFPDSFLFCQEGFAMKLSRLIDVSTSFSIDRLPSLPAGALQEEFAQPSEEHLGRRSAQPSPATAKRLFVASPLKDLERHDRPMNRPRSNASDLCARLRNTSGNKFAMPMLNPPFARNRKHAAS